jgi:hypothetical protein
MGNWFFLFFFGKMCYFSRILYYQGTRAQRCSNNVGVGERKILFYADFHIENYGIPNIYHEYNFKSVLVPLSA